MEERIINLLEDKFVEEEFADCFLIDIRHSGKKLEVFLDSDSGITFDKCQRISRHLEAALDENGWLGEDYVLEVSSPGVDRPLKYPRQYPKHVGRKLEVTTKEQEKHEGKLLEVEADAIVLEEKQRRKEGKRTKTEVVRTTIPFDNIAKTMVKISF